MDLNVVSFTGRLGADPTMRYTPQGTAVASLRLAVNVAKEKTLWFDVTAWGKLGENANQYLHKGSQLAVSGRLDQDEWEGNDGVKRTTLKIVANDIRFIGPKQEASEAQPQQQVAESMVNLDDAPEEDEFPL